MGRFIRAEAEWSILNLSYTDSWIPLRYEPVAKDSFFLSTFELKTLLTQFILTWDC